MRFSKKTIPPLLTVLFAIWIFSPWSRGVMDHPFTKTFVKEIMPFVVVVAPLILRWWLARPEPSDEEGSAALLDAYMQLRHTKAWGVYALALTLVIPVTLFAIAGAFDLGSDYEIWMIFAIMWLPAVATAVVKVRVQLLYKSVAQILERKESGYEPKRHPG